MHTYIFRSFLRFKARCPLILVVDVYAVTLVQVTWILQFMNALFNQTFYYGLSLCSMWLMTKLGYDGHIALVWNANSFLQKIGYT